jgi:cytochrome c oxidase subunit IV
MDVAKRVYLFLFALLFVLSALATAYRYLVVSDYKVYLPEKGTLLEEIINPAL